MNPINNTEYIFDPIDIWNLNTLLLFKDRQLIPIENTHPINLLEKKSNKEIEMQLSKFIFFKKTEYVIRSYISSSIYFRENYKSLEEQIDIIKHTINSLKDQLIKIVFVPPAYNHKHSSGASNCGLDLQEVFKIHKALKCST